MQTHRRTWMATGTLALALAVVAGCGSSKSTSAMSAVTGAAASTAPAAPSPTPSPTPSEYTVSQDAAQAALPSAKATSDGWTSASPTITGAVSLCLHAVKLPDGWTSAQATWQKETGGHDFTVDVRIAIAPDGADVDTVLNTAVSKCPNQDSDSDVQAVNQVRTYLDSDSTWNGERNFALGVLDGKTGFDNDAILLEKGQVLVNVEVLGLPVGNGSADIAQPIAIDFTDAVVQALGSPS